MKIFLKKLKEGIVNMYTKGVGNLKRVVMSKICSQKHPLSDMENLLSVWENVLSIASVTKSGEYYIKKRESATSSKIFINSNIIIWFGEYSYLIFILDPSSVFLKTASDI